MKPLNELENLHNSIFNTAIYCGVKRSKLKDSTAFEQLLMIEKAFDHLNDKLDSVCELSMLKDFEQGF